MKPQVTKQAAERFAFELRYSPEPNWETYSRLLALGTLLMDELKDLKPRDFIDVQSFIWCIGNASYKSGPRHLRQDGTSGKRLR